MESPLVNVPQSISCFVPKNNSFYAREITTQKPAILLVFVGSIFEGFFGTAYRDLNERSRTL
jgi:hypothetical protein